MARVLIVFAHPAFERRAYLAVADVEVRLLELSTLRVVIGLQRIDLRLARVEVGDGVHVGGA